MNNYYEWCKKRDIISKLKAHLLRGGYYLRDVDGKLTADGRMGWDTPWHHIYHHNQLDCGTWHGVLFDGISAILPEDEVFVPSQCQNCYKVVVRPQTLKQLFILAELQKTLGRPSKCGIEVRATVHGLYGGYFYNRGIESGIECYKEVRDHVNRTEGLGTDVVVLLKRACTEFEHKCGPSDKWKITPQQMEIEDLVDEWVTNDVKLRQQPAHAIAYIHRTWIEYAYKNGDPTYAEYTNGKPLYPPYVTYHHLAEEETKEEQTTKAE